MYLQTPKWHKPSKLPSQFNDPDLPGKASIVLNDLTSSLTMLDCHHKKIIQCLSLRAHLIEFVTNTLDHDLLNDGIAVDSVCFASAVY